ncbi:DUF885 family protein [Salinispora sp. H7-4]|nr:DUF885 family protein [Salinispora sp. H7-4]
MTGSGGRRRPGQALAYKAGERVWLAGRSSFPGDRRAFHRHALELGSLGLDQLTAALQQVDHVRSGRPSSVSTETGPASRTAPRK